MNKVVFEILPEMENERIDKCISCYLTDLSRSYIQKIIKEGNVLVNDIVVKTNYRSKVEDRVVCCIPDSVEPDIPAQKYFIEYFI